MGLAVYNALPMIIHDGNNEHHFKLKLNPSTDSFRLENGFIKRSVFIERRMFNKLYQLIKNEYGSTMGRIQFSGNDMRRGSVSTTENAEYQFEIYEGEEVEVIIKNEATPAKRLRVTIPNSLKNTREKEIFQGALIPSVLAALIFSKEANLIA